MKQSIRMTLMLLGVVISLVIFYAWDHSSFEHRLSALLKDKDIQLLTAVKDVDVLSKNSRYIGTEGHVAAQKYIHTRLGEYLEYAQITSNTVRMDTVIKGRFVQAPVTNIIGFLPATLLEKDSKNIALFAHYDSAESSFGTNDNAAGVATLLTVVDYVNRQKIRNYNLWVVFVDAEEIGLLGSKALQNSGFLESVDYAINIEARGRSGHSVIFESIGSDEALYSYITQSGLAYTDSVLLDIYKILPNMTDVDQLLPSLEKNIKLLINIAYFGNGFAYHNELDAKDALNDQGLLHHISQSIALLDYATDRPQSHQQDSAALFIKTITKSLSVKISKSMLTILGYLFGVALLFFAVYQYRVYLSQQAAQAQRLWVSILKFVSSLFTPIFPTVIVVLVCVLLSRLLGDPIALSNASLLIYAPILAFVTAVVLTLLVRRLYGLGLARLGADLFLIVLTVITCTQEYAVSTVLVMAIFLRGFGILLSLSFPKFSLPVLVMLIATFFVYNLHLFEVLLYLGGIKTPLILTVFIMLGISGNLIELIGIQSNSRMPDRRKNTKAVLKPNSVFVSDPLVLRNQQ